MLVFKLFFMMFSKPLQAAWGELQKNDTQLLIRSYELGILLDDETSLSMIPYDMPLTKYSEKDLPWICDQQYTEPDILGNTW